MVNAGINNDRVPILFACNKHDLHTAVAPDTIKSELAKELYVLVAFDYLPSWQLLLLHDDDNND
jgi:signal recognition particle receptor subunit beta